MRDRIRPSDIESQIERFPPVPRVNRWRRPANIGSPSQLYRAELRENIERDGIEPYVSPVYDNPSGIPQLSRGNVFQPCPITVNTTTYKFLDTKSHLILPYLATRKFLIVINDAMSVDTLVFISFGTPNVPQDLLNNPSGYPIVNYLPFNSLGFVTPVNELYGQATSGDTIITIMQGYSLE